MKNDNLQQIPSRTKEGREVRKGFIAAPGCKLVTRDFSQLHLRILAHLANEKVMIAVFEQDGDIHVETAMRAFGISDPALVDRATQRDPSKTAIFLTIYGGGGMTLLDTLTLNFALAACDCLGASTDNGRGKCEVCGGSVNRDTPDWLTLEWCDEFIEKTHDIYSGVPVYFGIQHYRCTRYGLTWCPFGRVRRVPEMKSCHERVRAAGLRQGGNHPIIGCEAGMVKVAQARVEDLVLTPARARGIHAEAIIPVHDEIVFEVVKDWADEIGELAGREMERCLEDVQTGEVYSRVPITTDGKTRDRWQKE